MYLIRVLAQNNTIKKNITIHMYTRNKHEKYKIYIYKRTYTRNKGGGGEEGGYKFYTDNNGVVRMQ